MTQTADMPVVTAVQALRQRTGERWLFGPACYPGEQGSYASGWRSYRQWLTQAASVPNRTATETVQRLRLLFAGRAGSAGELPGLLLGTNPSWSAASLTTDDVPLPTLNGLYRTGLVDFGPGTQAVPRLVDLTRVYLLLDVAASGPSPIGATTGAVNLLGWPGLLAQAWLGYEARRRAARDAARSAGSTWTEDPTNLGQPSQWLDQAIVRECPLERLFGVFDGAVLAAQWSTGTQLPALLAGYYDIDQLGPYPPGYNHMTNRVRLFVTQARPEIPHHASPAGDVTLKMPPETAPLAPVVVHDEVAGAAAWIAYLRAGRQNPLTAWTETNEALQSPWGSAMLARLTDAFISFLTTALPSDGWTSGSWPATPRALNRYGGWELRRGDDDAGQVYGGETRAGLPPTTYVSTLQQDLNTLRFPVTDAPGSFGPSTMAALRELQNAASSATIATHRRGSSVVTRSATHRRYLGAAHGVLDEETARTIDVWRNPAANGLTELDLIVRPDLNTNSRDTLLERTSRDVYTWAALTQGRLAANPTLAQWRQIGVAQKRLYRRRLLQRFGFPASPGTDPPFVFNTEDATNLFQLEAVVEFFLNYTDPWVPDSHGVSEGVNRPRLPYQAGGVTPNTDYLRVELSDPHGVAAHAVPGDPTNRLLQLDGSDDLCTVWFPEQSMPAGTHRDLIYLDSAQSHWYRVTLVDLAARVVQLDRVPDLTAGTTFWRIIRRPRLVIVDPAGYRRGMIGWHASAVGPNLRVENSADLSKVNNNFDTVYLASDAARPSRTYRIVGCDPVHHTLTLDGNPVLDNGESPWHLPAGLGGFPDPFEYVFPANTHGTDHYGALMFLVYADEVRMVEPWTSYTSTRWAARSDASSSAHGNREFDLMSAMAGSQEWINYGWIIRSTGQVSDTVPDARYYFDEVTNPPTAAVPTVGVAPDADGKTAIMIHDGHTATAGDLIDGQVPRGTGSAGCMVSPRFYAVRAQLITNHEQESANLGEPVPASMETLRTRQRADSQQVFRNSQPGATGTPKVPRSDWDGYIAGRLFAVRPEERPLE